MPESEDVKYYPVLVRVLRLLGGLPVTTYRAGIVAHKGRWVTERSVIDRFVMEYKGAEYSFGEYPNAAGHYRSRILEYLERKCLKAKHYDKHELEPIVEIEIDLRQVVPVTVA